LYNKNLNVAKKEKGKRVLSLYADGALYHKKALQSGDVELDTFLFDMCGLILSLSSYISVSRFLRKSIKKENYFKLTHMPAKLENCKSLDEAFHILDEFCILVDGVCV
jgi:hypothetical protein